MHPSNQITKTYIVKIKGDIKKRELLTLEKGVLIDGKMSAPCKAKFRSFDFKTKVSTVELHIHEGMYHQVKKMFEAINHPVRKLHRSHIAFLDLEGIPQGNYRKLTFHEVKRLYFLAQEVTE
jgi:23S rRNA pseudouridine2605 synthase